MKAKEQRKRVQEVQTKNQERCLKSQPFSRQRAYLTKQKCQKNIVSLQQFDSLGVNTLLKLERSGELEQEQDLAASNGNEIFDSQRIQQQMSRVRDVIEGLELRQNIKGGNNKGPAGKPKRIKTSFSTRAESVNSPKSLDVRDRWKKIGTEEQNSKESAYSSKREFNEKLVTSYYGQSSVRDTRNKMVRIKSNRNVLKVYNPYPTPMAEMF